MLFRRSNEQHQVQRLKVPEDCLASAHLYLDDVADSSYTATTRVVCRELQSGIPRVSPPDYLAEPLTRANKKVEIQQAREFVMAACIECPFSKYTS